MIEEEEVSTVESDSEEEEFESDSEEEEVGSDTKWTDLPLLKHGRLTALEIQEERRRWWIQRIRAR